MEIRLLPLNIEWLQLLMAPLMTGRIAGNQWLRDSRQPPHNRSNFLLILPAGRSGSDGVIPRMLTAC